MISPGRGGRVVPMEEKEKQKEKKMKKRQIKIRFDNTTVNNNWKNIYKELFACKGYRGSFVVNHDQWILFEIERREIDEDLWLNLQMQKKEKNDNDEK